MQLSLGPGGLALFLIKECSSTYGELWSHYIVVAGLSGVEGCSCGPQARAVSDGQC